MADYSYQFTKTEKNADEAAELISLLANSVRFRIFQVLCHEHPSVKDLAQRVEANSAQISKYLSDLYDRGIVDRNKVANEAFYSLKSIAIKRLVHTIETLDAPNLQAL